MSKYAPHGKSASQPRATSSTICQKCLGTGHYIYQCKGSRPYISRPSRTKMLDNPKLLSKLKADGKPSVEIPEEFKAKSGTANRILSEKEKERAKDKAADREEGSSKKRRRCILLFSRSHGLQQLTGRFRSGSASSSSDSDSDSDSDSSSGSSGSDSSSESDSDDTRSRTSKSPPRKRRYRSESRSRSSSRGMR
ncbi:zinc knuckle-domain-containing protein [Trametes gibbosa]|nr:zinc knuckle-domain-containing protein [Trametes gibbosa]